jgi:hypothetical protein
VGIGKRLIFSRLHRRCDRSNPMMGGVAALPPKKNTAAVRAKVAGTKVAGTKVAGAGDVRCLESWSNKH